jgi:Spy/CpxP family protein refolding chaperone
MNRKLHTLTLTFAVLLALTGVRAIAQTDSTSMATDPETRAKVQQHLQKMSSDLNLTEDQKQKIQPILQSEFQQAKSVHDDSSLSPDQKQAKMQEIRENAKSQVGPVLTPDQRAKWAAMKDQGKDNPK